MYANFSNSWLLAFSEVAVRISSRSYSRRWVMSRIDTTAPVLSVTAPVAGEASVSPTYNLAGTASDAGSGIDQPTVTYSINGFAVQ